MNKILLGSIITLVVIVIVSFIFIYSGFYNLSATIPHTKATESAIHLLKEKSINANSKNVKVPNLKDKSLVLNGYKGYDEMCVTCHSTPGKSETVIQKGLYPKPPQLYKKEIIEEWSDKELFWIVKNGIKLTGMPAYGPTHDDKELWDIVAFLKKLPNLSEEEYSSMKEITKDMNHDHDHVHSNDDKHEHDQDNNHSNKEENVNIHKDEKLHEH